MRFIKYLHATNIHIVEQKVEQKDINFKRKEYERKCNRI